MVYEEKLKVIFKSGLEVEIVKLTSIKSKYTIKNNSTRHAS